jgi:hypothetical protein
MFMACLDSYRCLSAALLAAATLVSCGGSINVKPANPEKAQQQPIERLRDTASLSQETQQVLRLYGLEDRLPDHPTAVLAILSGLRGSELEHVALAAAAEVSLLVGLNVSAAEVSEAAGWYLLSAARAYEFLFGGDLTPIERAMDPRFQRIRRVYNVAVGKYVEALKSADGGIRNHERATRFEVFQVDLEIGSQTMDPSLCDALLVARDLKIKGLRNRYRRNGLGAALVAYRENRSRTEPLDQFYPPQGVVGPATAVLEFGARAPRLAGAARSAKLSFYDPREIETVRLGGLDVPLQADYTTPFAYMASLSDLSGLGRKGLLNPEEHTERMGLSLMEPYDPEKIPVIMVHGLRSSPLAWMELTNDLFGDPVLRDRYQIWQFFYPTGLPYLYVGAILRSRLADLRFRLDPEGDDLAINNMVIVAHSMGGLVTRSLVCESSMEIWSKIFKVPPDHLRGRPGDIQWVKGMFIFSPEPFIERVIFIATPHRGAEAAGGIVGHIGSSMVELPDQYTERIERIIADNRQFATPEMTALIDKGAPNSIRALRPTHPVLQALGRLPVDPNIPYHTIIGNRGRDPAEPISDGWVDYESAHLVGAESEAVVPAGHAAYAHPASISEIRRILRLNLRESP